MKLDDFPYLKTSSLQMEFLVEKLREWNLLKKKGTQESVLNEHAKSLSELWEQFLNGLLSEPASKTSPGRVGELFDAYFRIEPHLWTDLRQAYEDLACHALGEAPSARGPHAFVTMTVKLIDAGCWGVPQRGMAWDLKGPIPSTSGFTKWIQLAVLEKDVRLLERLLDWPGSAARVCQDVLTRNAVQNLWSHTWTNSIHKDLSGWQWVIRHASDEHMVCWLKAGLDPNAYTADGMPAAAFTDDPEVLTVLFEAGANPLSQMTPKDTRLHALDALWEGWKRLLLQDYSSVENRGSWKQGWDYLQQQLQLWPTSDIQQALKSSWVEAFLNRHIYSEEAGVEQPMDLLSNLVRHPHVTPTTELEVEGETWTFATAAMRFWLQYRWGFREQDPPRFDAHQLKEVAFIPSGMALQALVDVAEKEEGSSRALKDTDVPFRELAHALAHLVDHNPQPKISFGSDRFNSLVRTMFDPEFDGFSDALRAQQELAVSILHALPKEGWMGPLVEKGQRPMLEKALPIVKWSHRLSSQLPASFLGGLACQFLAMSPGIFPVEQGVMMRTWLEAGLQENSSVVRRVGKGAVGWLVRTDPEIGALLKAEQKKRRLDRVWSQPEEASPKRRIRL